MHINGFKDVPGVTKYLITQAQEWSFSQPTNIVRSTLILRDMAGCRTLFFFFFDEYNSRMCPGQMTKCSYEI